VNPLFNAAADIQAFCSARHWRCAIIGGLAVQRWGEPRQTRDIDLTLAALPFEERVIERSSEYAFDAACTVKTCSAEDLITLKVFADRAQDWLDVEGIIVRQGSALNRVQILDELAPLLELKEDMEPQAKLRSLFAKHR